MEEQARKLIEQYSAELASLNNQLQELGRQMILREGAITGLRTLLEAEAGTPTEVAGEATEEVPPQEPVLISNGRHKRG